MRHCIRLWIECLFYFVLASLLASNALVFQSSWPFFETSRFRVLHDLHVVTILLCGRAV